MADRVPGGEDRLDAGQELLAVLDEVDAVADRREVLARRVDSRRLSARPDEASGASRCAKPHGQVHIGLAVPGGLRRSRLVNHLAGSGTKKRLLLFLCFSTNCPTDEPTSGRSESAFWPQKMTANRISGGASYDHHAPRDHLNRCPLP